MALLGAMQAAFAAGFASNAGKMGSLINQGGMAAPDFNQLYVKAIGDIKGGLNIKDLQNLKKVLDDFEPGLYSKFTKQAKKLGDPARKKVNEAFRKVDAKGPLGAPKRKGRTYDKMYTLNGRPGTPISWQSARAKRNAVDVNYKARSTSAVNRAIASQARMTAKDKTLSIIRVRVRAPGYIIADLAGSGRVRKTTGTLTRQYSINLFGKGVVVRSHKVNAGNVNNWIENLNNKGKPSRYAWPAFIAHGKDYRTDVGNLVNEYVVEANRRQTS